MSKLILFGEAIEDDFRFSYIDPILGLVRNVTFCEAKEYDKKNPGTIFIFRSGKQVLRYLNIKQVKNLIELSTVTNSRMYSVIGYNLMTFNG